MSTYHAYRCTSGPARRERAVASYTILVRPTPAVPLAFKPEPNQFLSRLVRELRESFGLAIQHPRFCAPFQFSTAPTNTGRSRTAFSMPASELSSGLVRMSTIAQ